MRSRYRGYTYDEVGSLLDPYRPALKHHPFQICRERSVVSVTDRGGGAACRYSETIGPTGLPTARLRTNSLTPPRTAGACTDALGQTHRIPLRHQSNLTLALYPDGGKGDLRLRCRRSSDHPIPMPKATPPPYRYGQTVCRPDAQCAGLYLRLPLR